MTTFAAFGDSITATYQSFTYINTATDAVLSADNIRTWPHYATNSTLQFVGGFARGGYKSTQIAEATSPILADFGVVMAGTNDIGPSPWGTPTADWQNAIKRIIVESRVPRAIVCAVAPRNDGAPSGTTERQRTLDYNAALKTYVESMGWTFFDPWATVRAADGSWAHSSLTYDGIHPTWQSAQRAGQKIAAEIQRLITP